MSNTDLENLVICGDWNVSLQALYKKGGSPWKATASRDQLVTRMQEFELGGCFQSEKSE